MNSLIVFKSLYSGFFAFLRTNTSKPIMAAYLRIFGRVLLSKWVYSNTFINLLLNANITIFYLILIQRLKRSQFVYPNQWWKQDWKANNISPKLLYNAAANGISFLWTFIFVFGKFFVNWSQMCRLLLPSLFSVRDSELYM